MGAFLETPITKKDSEAGAGGTVSYAVSQMQGWRSSMEDAHTAVADIPELPGCSFFAVFDGHAGSFMSRSCSTAIVKAVVDVLVPRKAELDNPQVVAEALKNAFLAVDVELRPLCRDGSGTTAIAVFLSPTHIIVANCGDSRCVISRAGGVWGTVDHKPASEDEKTRIGNAGGFVAMNRVNGCLAVSRALGDYEFKKRSDLAAEQQQVSAEPEITVLDRLPTDEFIVLCCDGVWDVLTNEECVDQIKKRAETADDVQVMEGLLDRCLELGSRDNMTSCVIRLQPRAPPKPVTEAAVASTEANEPMEAVDAPVSAPVATEEAVALPATQDAPSPSMPPSSE